MHSDVKAVLEENQELRYICNNQYFMMRQLSDVTDQNIFDHIVFVDTEPIKDVLSRDHNLVSYTNEYVEDKHSQMFLSDEIYKKYKKVFEIPVTQGTYKVIPSYADMFKGFIRTQNFFILLNSAICKERFPVFVLVNSKSQNIKVKHIKKNIEFYGYIFVGYLVNPTKYTNDQLTNFEEEKSIIIPPLIKQLMLAQPFITYNNKLYHFNLKDINSSLMIRFTQKGKRFNNIKFIKAINEAQTSEAKEKAILENNEYVSHMCNGFMYLGVVSKVVIPHRNVILTKLVTKLYLLVNFEEQHGVDYSCTLWERTYMNNNVERLLRLYTNKDINQDITTLTFEEDQIDLNDPGQIIHSMNFIKDV